MMNQFEDDMAYEFNARYDYIREAFGDTGTDCDSEEWDQDPDHLVGGVTTFEACRAVIEGLNALVRACDVFDQGPDYIPF
jgi:hypothetical protein